MKGNRKAAEDLCLSIIAEIVPDGSQVPIYKTMFSKMSNKEFNEFITHLKNKKKRLSIISPNFRFSKLNI